MKKEKIKQYRFRIGISVLLLCLSVFIGVFVYKVCREKSPADNPAAASEVETESPTESTVPSTQPDYEQTLILSNPKETDITVTEALLTVAGVCDTGYTLTINEVPVELASDGSFSHDVVLVPGENSILITNGVKSITLKATYKYQVIQSVSPTKNLTVEGSTKIEMQAVALKGAHVSATIGKTKISFTEVETDAAAIAKAGVDFVEYIGYYTAPEATEKKRNLGRIKFSASYNDYTEKKNGATVYVNAAEPKKIPVNEGQGIVRVPPISGDGYVEVLTPSSDCGLGKTRMCTVNVPFSETASNSAGNDKSDPLCTPLLKGTVDYITGEARYDDKTYYLLNSGVKIQQKECNVVDGYILTSNTISAYKSYTENNTNIILTENWKVPFNTEMKKQDYIKGYSGRAHNVASFTASYIDFVFSYTNAAEGSFDLSGSNVVKRAEWVNIGVGGKTTLRVHLKKAGVFYGYRAYYSSDNRLVISFNNRPESVDAAVVAIDPGHGGSDPGAIGVNGNYESKLNFSIAKKIQANLEALGVQVIMLRTGDVYSSLDDRQLAARECGADLFVSLHNNSSTSNALSGPEVYYYRANAKPLASAIHKRLVTAWQSIYADDSAMRKKADNGAVRYYPFRVTRIEECPAVLVECGYLSNAKECSSISSSVNQDLLAKAVANGIADCLRDYK